MPEDTAERPDAHQEKLREDIEVLAAIQRDHNGQPFVGNPTTYRRGFYELSRILTEHLLADLERKVFQIDNTAGIEIEDDR